jgi:hypothetical protein
LLNELLELHWTKGTTTDTTTGTAIGVATGTTTSPYGSSTSSSMKPSMSAYAKAASILEGFALTSTFKCPNVLT